MELFNDYFYAEDKVIFLTLCANKIPYHATPLLWRYCLDIPAFAETIIECGETILLHVFCCRFNFMSSDGLCGESWGAAFSVKLWRISWCEECRGLRGKLYFLQRIRRFNRIFQASVKNFVEKVLMHGGSNT